MEKLQGGEILPPETGIDNEGYKTIAKYWQLNYEQAKRDLEEARKRIEDDTKAFEKRLASLMFELGMADTEARQLSLRVDRLVDGSKQHFQRAERAEADARALARMYHLDKEYTDHLADCGKCRLGGLAAECDKRNALAVRCAIAEIEDDVEKVAAKYLKDGEREEQTK